MLVMGCGSRRPGRAVDRRGPSGGAPESEAEESCQRDAWDGCATDHRVSSRAPSS